MPELQFKNEEEYRFYSELKRTAKKAEISEGTENIGFNRGDSKFIFSGGEILAIKDNNIVARIELDEFARKPSQMFRLLQYAIQENVVKSWESVVFYVDLMDRFFKRWKK